MDSSMETKNAPEKPNKVRMTTVVAAVVIVALLAVIIVLLVRPSGGDDSGIGYASEAKVMLDEDDLQAAVDAALRNAEDGNVALQYQNDAFSNDGKTFSCNIVNSPENLYDMFLTIYADSELKDQIFLSELVPPGSGFEKITLDHALPAGDNTVYVVVTQVDTEEETGEQVIKNQVTHTIVFHVM